MILWILITGIAALLYIILAFLYLKKQEKGTKKMQEISSLIKKGSKTFLKTENKVLAIAVLIIAFFMAFFDFTLALFFLIGSVLASVSGIFGMYVATNSNAKVAASKNLQNGMRIAFASGLIVSVFGMIIGIIAIYSLYKIFDDAQMLYGFGFGVGLVALFMRVGGGIYTKSADIAADLVGKVEKNLPEDDERNPAVIADLVGDNVGDVAGMSADLFESYVESIIATMVIALALLQDVFVPIKIASIGIIASICSIITMKGKKVYSSLINALIISSLIVAIFSFIFLREYIYIIILGLITGLVVSLSVIYYTSFSRKPTINVSEAATKGGALVVLRGLCNGMISTFIPVIAVSAAMILSSYLGGIFGVSIAAVSMLSILGVTLASTVFGSISDNAAGIAEMARMKKNREIADTLDAAGNTTAAVGKGFTIGSAALTTLTLLASYVTLLNITTMDILKAENLAVLFVGAALPFMFSSVIINAVSSSAEKIVEEVRAQLKNKKIMTRKVRPNYEKAISLATSSSIKNMLLPSILSVTMTVTIGLLFGVESLGSFIVGVTSTSLLLSIFMANAGSSLDNAKKYIEKGHFGGKGSDAHKAAVIGDTVGDPLKDTAGPSLDILIKLVAITSLLLVLLKF